MRTIKSVGDSWPSGSLEATGEVCRGDTKKLLSIHYILQLSTLLIDLGSSTVVFGLGVGSPEPSASVTDSANNGVA